MNDWRAAWDWLERDVTAANDALQREIDGDFDAAEAHVHAGRPLPLPAAPEPEAPGQWLEQFGTLAPDAPNETRFRLPVIRDRHRRARKPAKAADVPPETREAENPAGSSPLLSGGTQPATAADETGPLPEMLPVPAADEPQPGTPDEPETAAPGAAGEPDEAPAASEAGTETTSPVAEPEPQPGRAGGPATKPDASEAAAPAELAGPEAAAGDSAGPARKAPARKPRGTAKPLPKRQHPDTAT